MLVLTRNIGESIYIDGKEIIITLLDIKGKQARLGISAPKGVSVHREEIYRRIERGEKIKETICEKNP